MKTLFIVVTSSAAGIGLTSVGLGVSDVGFWCGIILLAAFNGVIAGLSK